MGLPQLCTADKCMRNEREKKKNISTTKSGTNNWFNWCGAWMRLINTIESVAKHVKQSVKKSDRLVKCYKLFSIHVRPISVRVKKKEEIQSNIRTFWKAFELQRENLLKNLTRPTHKWYTHNILWPMCLQYNLFLFLNALHDTLGCYAAGFFFSSLEKNNRFLCLKFT